MLNCNLEVDIKYLSSLKLLLAIVFYHSNRKESRIATLLLCWPWLLVCVSCHVHFLLEYLSKCPGCLSFFSVTPFYFFSAVGVSFPSIHVLLPCDTVFRKASDMSGKSNLPSALISENVLEYTGRFVWIPREETILHIEERERDFSKAAGWKGSYLALSFRPSVNRLYLRT